jgi:hypothetical protein
MKQVLIKFTEQTLSSKTFFVTVDSRESGEQWLTENNFEHIPHPEEVWVREEIIQTKLSGKSEGYNGLRAEILEVEHIENLSLFPKKGNYPYSHFS